MKNTIWWFCIVGENSELCGEEFLVEIDYPTEDPKAAAKKQAAEIFPYEKIRCYGRVTPLEAEMMGLDIY